MTSKESKRSGDQVYVDLGSVLGRPIDLGTKVSSAPSDGGGAMGAVPVGVGASLRTLADLVLQMKRKAHSRWEARSTQ